MVVAVEGRVKYVSAGGGAVVIFDPIFLSFSLTNFSNITFDRKVVALGGTHSALKNIIKDISVFQKTVKVQDTVLDSPCLVRS